MDIPSHMFRHHRLVGTTVDIRVVGARADEAAEEIDGEAIAEMERLEAVFNGYDPDSELSRWRRGSVDSSSSDLAEVLGAALRWQEVSDGRFNPLAGLLVERWREAERAGQEPSDDELAAIAAAIAAPRFEIHDGAPVRTGECGDLVLNAIAKGYIVDRVVALAARPDVTVVVNAGGDLAHRGPHPIEVGVENPLRPYDNEPPLTAVQLADRAIATSGGARRGVRIGGRRYSHVVDPRTGRPADELASVTVLAPDAMTADVAATVLNVTRPADVVAEARRFGVECLAVSRDGSQWRSPGFREV